MILHNSCQGPYWYYQVVINLPVSLTLFSKEATTIPVTILEEEEKKKKIPTIGPKESDNALEEKP